MQSKETKIKKTTLAELGPKLPIGIVDSKTGTLGKVFSVRPWRLKEERELGKIRAANENASVAQYVAMILATMCTRFGNHDFEKMKFEERRLILSSAYMADVFYAYIWLRRDAIGSELSLKITCSNSNCHTNFEFTGDLGSIDVGEVDSLVDTEWIYKLKTPITVRGKLIEHFKFGPSRWNTLETIPAGTRRFDTGAAKSAIIRGSILEAGELGAIPLVDDELDELTKFDLERITTAINERPVGPTMSIEGKCTSCGAPFEHAIEWATDNFFEPSSS
jgi:hypothetical protein